MSAVRFSDFATMAGRSLTQNRTRSLLTLLGVFLGAFLLVISLSVGKGITESVERTLSFGGKLKRIQVYPDYSIDPDQVPEEDMEIEGDVAPERRERLRKQLAESWRAKNNYRPGTPLSESLLQTIERWERVESVTPDIQISSRGVHRDKSMWGMLYGQPAAEPILSELIVAGNAFDRDDARTILVHEFLAYEWGYRSDEELQQLPGQTIELRFGGDLAGGIAGMVAYHRGGDVEFTPEEERQLAESLERLAELVDTLPIPEAQREVLKKTFAPAPDESPPAGESFSETYTVAGVFRSPSEAELITLREQWQLAHTQFILPLATARALAQRLPEHRDRGYQQVMVLARDESDVAALAERLRGEGVGVHSMTEFIEQVRKHVTVITSVMATLAAVALLVAALGISNVMAMSVLERTREIGIMKAVGAEESQIQRLFLIEGGLLGLLGGAAGVFCGWLASFPGNAVARWVLDQRGFQEKLEGSLFSYPLWVVLGVPAFAAAITMLAAWLPSRRAARIDPIEALRQG